MALKDEIIVAIRQAVTDHFQNEAATPEQVEAQRNLNEYLYRLGFLAIEQNPYAPMSELEIPTRIPVEDGETRRIRRIGPLADKHAGNPLGENGSIPGGMPF